MFRYKLRTLLILLAVGPPVLVGGWFTREPLRLLVCVVIAGAIFEIILRLSMIGRAHNP